MQLSSISIFYLVSFLFSLVASHASLPTREAFGKQKRELGQVPVSAFELDPVLGEDLKIEVWAQSPQVFTPVAMDMDAQGRTWAEPDALGASAYHRANRQGYR